MLASYLFLTFSFDSFASSAVDKMKRTWKYEKYDEAIVLATPLANAGDAFAQYVIGSSYMNGFGHFEKNFGKAYQWLNKSADQGFSRAFHKLGLLYYYGNGVKSDHKIAFNYFSKSAAEGYALSQHNVGLLLEAGEGVEHDLEKAYEFFLRAANQGHADSQYSLGEIYRKGLGKQKNLKTAFDWYMLAANWGHVDAQFRIGYFYEHGYGTAKNIQKAIEWYGNAATVNHLNAIDSLGNIYLLGAGIEKDSMMALKWYLRGWNAGNLETVEYLLKMEASGLSNAFQISSLLQYINEHVNTDNEIMILRDLAEVTLNLWLFNSQHHFRLIYSGRFEWAVVLLQRIVLLGDNSALLLLGDMYAKHKCNHYSHKMTRCYEAIFYYQLAAKRGNTDANDKLIELRKLESSFTYRLKDGSDPRNQKRKTLLLKNAMESKSLSDVEVLLRADTDPNSPMIRQQVLLGLRDSEILYALLAHGFKVTADMDATQLWHRAEFHDLFPMTIAGLNINKMNSIGDYPIKIIRRVEKRSIALLQLGANPFKLSRKGKTHFGHEIAKRKYNVFLMQYFIDRYQPDLDRRDEQGKTMLELAVENRYFQSIKLLVDSGADTSIKTSNGETLLTLAANNERYLKKETAEFISKLAEERIINLGPLEQKVHVNIAGKLSKLRSAIGRYFAVSGRMVRNSQIQVLSSMNRSNDPSFYDGERRRLANDYVERIERNRQSSNDNAGSIQIQIRELVALAMQVYADDSIAIDEFVDECWKSVYQFFNDDQELSINICRGKL